VQVMRFADGSRRIVQIGQILPLDNQGRYQTEDLFVLRLPQGERELSKATLQWTGAKIVFRNEVGVQAALRNLPSLEPLVTDDKDVRTAS
jgi:hypothetical protein